MLEFGVKIKRLRKRKKLTRQTLCGDGKQLSIRQLERIENGKSSPSMKHLEWLAQRLGVRSYELMPDYVGLPERYQDIKYFLLRQPIYGVRELVDKQAGYLDEIFNEFYWDLPKEEQFLMDLLQAMIEVHVTGETSYGQAFIDSYIDDFMGKRTYQLKDLLFIRLLSAYFHSNHQNGRPNAPKYEVAFDIAFVRLLKQGASFAIRDLPIYANSILSGLSYYHLIGNYAFFTPGVMLLEEIIQKTKDFRNQPLLLMLKWQEAIFVKKDFVLASQKYQDAKTLVRLTGQEKLVLFFDQEWAKDLEKR